MTIRPEQGKLEVHVHRNIEGWKKFASGTLEVDKSTGKRILLVWDFATVPYTIGELLYLQIRGLMLKWLHQAEHVDLAFICNPESPARKDQGLTPYNYHPHFASLVPVPLVSPTLGNFLLFDSHSEFERYLRRSAESYAEIWPTAEDYRSRKPAYTDSLTIIESFFAEHGWVPHLSFRPVMQDWAQSFFLRTVLPDIPVTVQLRNNAAMKHGLRRNSRLESWLQFFHYCAGRFPVKFVVICAWTEVDPRLRECPNVVVAKDSHTSLEQDLALIQSSALFMGGSSGPALVAVFSKLPYLIFNVHTSYESRPRGTQHVFASSHQKLVWEPESAELLIREFTTSMEQLDTPAWLDDCTDRLLSGSLEAIQSPFTLR
jgi:hypothetical protein